MTALWITVGILVGLVVMLGARLIVVEKRLRRHERLIVVEKRLR